MGMGTGTKIMFRLSEVPKSLVMLGIVMAEVYPILKQGNENRIKFHHDSLPDIVDEQLPDTVDEHLQFFCTQHRVW